MRAWLRSEIERYEGYIADLRAIEPFDVFQDSNETVERYTALVNRYKEMLEEAAEH